jgi:hypothetical protein
VLKGTGYGLLPGVKGTENQVGSGTKPVILTLNGSTPLLQDLFELFLCSDLLLLRYDAIT